MLLLDYTQKEVELSYFNNINGIILKITLKI